MGIALFSHQSELFFELQYPFAEQPAVGFDLRFALTAVGNAAAALAGKVSPFAREPGQGIFQPGKFDLKYRFSGAGAVGKYIQNDLFPADDRSAERKDQEWSTRSLAVSWG